MAWNPLRIARSPASVRFESFDLQSAAAMFGQPFINAKSDIKRETIKIAARASLFIFENTSHELSSHEDNRIMKAGLLTTVLEVTDAPAHHIVGLKKRISTLSQH